MKRGGHSQPLPASRCQFTLTALLLSIAVCAFVFVAIRTTWSVIGTGAIRDAYGGLQLSSMLIEYMKHNNGDWPRNWNDLHPYYASALANGSDYCTFEVLKESMDVDFTVNVRDVAADDRIGVNRVPRFICPKAGETTWGGWHPNLNILSYIQENYRTKTEKVRKGEGD